MVTLDIFRQQLRIISPSSRFCVALSGGLDSMALLHLLYRVKTLEPELSVRAIHINHGLSQHSATWVAMCEQVCDNYQIPITVHHLSLKKNKQESLEERARLERYEVFSALLEEGETLVTAHHQNDQAETLLLQLFRGAGPKGLAAMPYTTPFKKGFLVRPLLKYTRSDLTKYAEQEQLQWVEDESNNDLSFDRNFLRHEVLPAIQQRWPRIIENLARSAQHCAEADRYIDNDIASLFHRVFIPEKRALCIAKLLLHDDHIQRYIIRFWLQYLRLALPSTQKLTCIQQDMLQARHDAMPLISWKGVEVRRYDGLLYAMEPITPHNTSLVIPWDLKTDLLLPNDLGVITLNEVSMLGLNPAELNQVTIRFRQGGERCRLKSRSHSHSLKKLFQEWRVPPWHRDRVPLLYANEQLKAVVGYVVCESLTPSTETGSPRHAT